jgi:ribosomal protein L7/L12
MKLILTHQEVLNIIRIHLNLSPANLEIEIQDPIDSKLESFKAWHNIVVKDSSRKIEAIKAVRTIYAGAGLADAKYAIEANLGTVVTYIRNHNNDLTGFSNFYHAPNK